MVQESPKSSSRCSSKPGHFGLKFVPAEALLTSSIMQRLCYLQTLSTGPINLLCYSILFSRIWLRIRSSELCP